MSAWLATSLSAAMLLCWAYFALGNAWLFIRYLLWRVPGSLIHLVGGLFGCGGMLLAPFPSWRANWWLPLVLDLGSAPMLLFAGWWGIRRLAHRREGGQEKR